MDVRVLEFSVFVQSHCFRAPTSAIIKAFGIANIKALLQRNGTKS